MESVASKEHNKAQWIRNKILEDHYLEKVCDALHLGRENLFQLWYSFCFASFFYIFGFEE